MLCEYGVQQTNFFIILGHFLSLYPTNNLKNQNSEKMKKKTHGDIIILHLSQTIMWCVVPEIERNRQICYFGLYFALLVPLTTWKIKILKK